MLRRFVIVVLSGKLPVPDNDRIGEFTAAVYSLNSAGVVGKCLHRMD